jgi:hypothetical protein
MSKTSAGGLEDSMTSTGQRSLLLESPGVQLSILVVQEELDFRIKPMSEAGGGSIDVYGHGGCQTAAWSAIPASAIQVSRARQSAASQATNSLILCPRR